MEGQISTAGISLDILGEIFELAYQKWLREKRYNPISEFNTIKILCSYNEILYQKNINSEKDQLYYNFIHLVGKQIPKGSTKDEWIEYCQQLFRSQQCGGRLISQQSTESIKNLTKYANRDYENKLMMKAFVVLLKNAIYRRQKKNELLSLQQQKVNNSPINEQEVFIAEQDSYIQYKRNQYQKSNLKSESSSTHLKNLPFNAEDNLQNIYLKAQNDNNQQSPPTYHSNYNKYQKGVQVLQERNEAERENQQGGKGQRNKKEDVHEQSIRQLTSKESQEYQRRLNFNDTSFQLNQNNHYKQSVISPSNLPLQPYNSPIVQNNPFLTSPNRLNNNTKKFMKNYNKMDDQLRVFQDLETVATASNTDHLASVSSNTNTFRNNKSYRLVKGGTNMQKDTKSLINCMYDNLDIIETNMDELGENAINMTKMSADFETSCISRGKNNTKFLDESYSFHQINTANNLFQTGHEESFDEMSFQQTDMQATLPHNTKTSTSSNGNINIVEYTSPINYNYNQTQKNLSTLPAAGTKKTESNKSLLKLDFDTIHDNIKILSAYFIKLQIYKNQHKKKRQIEQQVKNMENEAQSYYIRKLKDKVFCLLKAFGIVSSETQGRYNELKNKNEQRLKRTYLYTFIEKYHERILERTQTEYLQKSLENNLLTKAFSSLREYHLKQYQKRMNANSLIFTSRTSIDFIVELYLNSLQQQLDHSELQNYYHLFQQCSSHLNYRPLIVQLIQNGLINQKNSKLLLRQQENVILTQKHTYFQVLKQLYERNQQATNLYNYKKMHKVFNVLKNYSQERMHLKEGLEQFISKNLFNRLQKIISSWKQIASSQGDLKRRGFVIFDKYKQKTIKTYITKWVQMFNSKQSDKSKIFKAQSLFFQITCKKILLQMKKYHLKQKQKSLMNEMAEKHSNNRTMSFFFDVMIVFNERAKIQREKSDLIEEKRNLITMKSCLNQWRLERFYNRMIKEFRLSKIFQQLMNGFKAEKRISRKYNQMVEQHKEKQQENKLKKVFQFLQGKADLSAQYYRDRDAFSYHYNKLLIRGFEVLKMNKDIKMQKYSNVYEYLNNKASMSKCTIFGAWKQRTLENEVERKSNKLALNFYIKKLFKLIIGTLSEYTKKAKINRQNKDLAQIYYKNNIWKRWRQTFIDKIVVKHDKMRLMTLGMKSFILNLNNNKKKIIKNQKADYFMYMMLFKKAQIFIELLKINREKSYFNKDAVLNAKSIIERNCKIRILRSLHEYTQKNREHTSKIHLMKQIKNLNLLKVCFIELMKNLANKKITIQKIHQKLKTKYKANMRQALSLWKESIQHENQELEIYDKGIFLQQTLLKKRFFNSLRLHHQLAYSEMNLKRRALQFQKKQLFYKFMGVFYKSIEYRKLKLIATKHFAANLLKRGFYGWKQHQMEIFEERYKKVDDYFENPFLMSQKKSTISLADKENFDFNQTSNFDEIEIERNFDSIMSYSSDKKNKSLTSSLQNTFLKLKYMK